LHERACFRWEVIQPHNVDFVDNKEGWFVAEERFDGVEEFTL
jgi:hypothetical protein